MHPLVNGLVTGLFLQLAIGPVFFFVLGITITSTFVNSLSAVLAVTVVDYLYIALSLVGVGGLTCSERGKKLWGIASSVILVSLGILLCYKGIGFMARLESGNTPTWTPLRSFTGSFILTGSSPLTILFWGSLLSAKAIEYNYEKTQLVWFGFGAGLATPAFLVTTMFLLSLGKAHIPAIVWQVANCLVGIALAYYGVSRAIQLSRRV